MEMDDKQKFVIAQMARADLYWYARYMFRIRKGYKWIQAPHHRVICDALMRVFHGQCRRLIINVPPRYSKTELAVINFISWAMGLVPDAEFIHTSYSGRLAGANAGQTQEMVLTRAYQEIFPDVRIDPNHDARDEWRTNKEGICYATGAGGTITGFGAGKMRPNFGGAIIIDDPHKPDEARSDTIRQGVIEWFQNTLESRVNSPHTPIIVIMQRLHEEDLAGWLLAGGNGEKWEHICLPAISDSGEPLWPEKHSIETLRRMEIAAPFTFSGQYQQRPTPADGAIFMPDKIGYVDAKPLAKSWVRAWDLASSEDDGDWTVGALLGLLPNDRYIIADVVRLQGRPEKVEEALLSTAVRDGVQVKISLPQDPGQAGKSQIVHLTKLLKGFAVTSSVESGDKVTRAEPFAAQVNLGLVDMVRADWNNGVVSELRFFPFGKHDDQVDALSRAFSRLTAPNGTGMLDFYRELAERQKEADRAAAVENAKRLQQ